MATPFLLKGSISSRTLARVWLRSDIRGSLVLRHGLSNAMGRECGGAGAAGDSLFQSPPRVEKKPTALLGAVDSACLFKLSYLHEFNGRSFVDAANKVRLGAYD